MAKTKKKPTRKKKAKAKTACDITKRRGRGKRLKDGCYS